MKSIRLRRRACRSPFDRSGTAAIEFALTAPILVSILFSISDLAPTLMAKFKVSAATQAVADLATQSSTMQAADVANFFASGGDVMAPFAATTLVLRVSNIASDGKGNAFIYWSCGQGMTPYPGLASVTTTPTGTPVTNLLTLTAAGTNTSYVMVESQYTYSSPSGYIFKSPQVMTGTTYTLPRVSTYIGPSSGTQGYVPPPPNAVRNNIQIGSGGVVCNITY